MMVEVALRFRVRVRVERESVGEGWSGECGRSVPSRQIVKPARRRRTRVVEENVLGACPYVHVCVLSEEVPFTRRSGAGRV